MEEGTGRALSGVRLQRNEGQLDEGIEETGEEMRTYMDRVKKRILAAHSDVTVYHTI